MIKNNVSNSYLQIAPAALAFERTIELSLLKSQDFEHPILDVGCGDGVFAKVAFERKIDVGIDSDPEEIKQANVHDMYSKLITCSASAIPAEDESFQTIISNSVLEHIESVEPVLLEINRLLKPNGRVYLTIPTDRLEQYSSISRALGALGLLRIQRIFQIFHNRFWKHFNAHSEEKWRSLFIASGFSVIEEQTYNNKKAVLFFDFLTLLAFPSFITKKLTGKWILFPWLRSKYVWILEGLLLRAEKTIRPTEGEGCLVFFVLSKK